MTVGEIQISGRVLSPTTMFDEMWEYIAKRKAIWDRRQAGGPAPWTEDEFLANNRFCNTYRVCDRASQFLIAHVIEEGSQKPEDVTFRVVLFNTFARIETYKLVERELGPLTWETYDYQKFYDVLQRAKEGGKALFTGSFQKPAPPLNCEEHFDNYLCLIDILMHDDLPGKLAKCKYLSDAYDLILSYPGMGSFLAHQLTLDLTYTNLLNFSECDFVAPGGGALAGIRKCFGSDAHIQGIEVDIIRWIQKTQNEHFRRLGLEFTGLGPEKRPLQLCDIEHCLCEIDKYTRLSHPGYSSAKGKTRTKVRGSFNPLIAPPLEEFRLPQAWSHPSRKRTRIKKEKPQKVLKRYVVESITKHRKQENSTETEYLVLWEGYSAKDSTWEPESMLKEDAPDVIKKYWKDQKVLDVKDVNIKTEGKGLKVEDSDVKVKTELIEVKKENVKVKIENAKVKIESIKVEDVEVIVKLENIEEEVGSRPAKRQRK